MKDPRPLLKLWRAEAKKLRQQARIDRDFLPKTADAEDAVAAAIETCANNLEETLNASNT